MHRSRKIFEFSLVSHKDQQLPSEFRELFTNFCRTKHSFSLFEILGEELLPSCNNEFFLSVKMDSAQQEGGGELHEFSIPYDENTQNLEVLKDKMKILQELVCPLIFFFVGESRVLLTIFCSFVLIIIGISSPRVGIYLI